VRCVILASFGFAVLALAGCGAAPGATVNMSKANDQYVFGPANVFINVDQAVTWANSSDAPHNVTSDSGTELASPDFNAGAMFSHTFAATGTFPYHCTIHTYMKGTVVVLAAGATPPPSS
jgi:plastocyanin